MAHQAKTSRCTNRTKLFIQHSQFPASFQWNAYLSSPRTSLITNYHHGRAHVSTVKYKKQVLIEIKLKNTVNLWLSSFVQKNTGLYRFGTDLRASCGSVEIRIPTPKNSFISLTVGFLNLIVPFPTDLDTLDCFGLYFSNIENTVCCPTQKENVPVVEKLGHAYFEWSHSQRIRFNKSELICLHREFQYPFHNKQSNLLKRARPEEPSEETGKVLNKISQSRKTCWKLGPNPIMLKASVLSEHEMEFEKELSMYLMWIEFNAVLHIIDSATRFSAAVISDDYGQIVEGTWRAFMDVWCTLYTAYPDRLRTGARSAFILPK